MEPQGPLPHSKESAILPKFIFGFKRDWGPLLIQKLEYFHFYFNNIRYKTIVLLEIIVVILWSSWWLLGSQCCQHWTVNLVTKQRIRRDCITNFLSIMCHAAQRDSRVLGVLGPVWRGRLSSRLGLLTHAEQTRYL